MRYFGGYSYVIEDFENSYEDSLIRGDIPCKTTYSGVEIDVPAFEFRAENRRGNLRSTLTSKVYGSTSSTRATLAKQNKKLRENNSKYIYNIDNGKKIKNKNYKK
ncbi:MAG: hypothetical protein ACK5MR_18620 [Cumulibacter sp.]